MAWVIRAASPGVKYPAEPMQYEQFRSRSLECQIFTLLRRLPLAQTVPEAFKVLPEYFIEDIIEFYLFLVK